MSEEQNIEKLDNGIENLPKQPSSPESSPERNPEQKEKFEQALERIDTAEEDNKEGELGQGGNIVAVSNQQLASEQRAKQIERILEKDMDSIYLGLSEEKKKEFKLAGEETAKRISSLVETGKAKAKTVIDLIKKWLSAVPGINKFFMEQEAKIKADEILDMNKNEKFE